MTAPSPALVGDAELEHYVQAVREALVDLPDEVRTDLLEDLPEHLAEIALEDDGTLRERLGAPADYASELRAAAGLAVGPWPVHDGLAPRIGRALRRGRVQALRLDGAMGKLMGYPSSRDLGRDLVPGWWVLRGWIAAQLLCRALSGYGWDGVVPAAGNSRTGGAAATIAAILLSIWIGRRAARVSAWPRGLLVIANLALLLWAVAVLIGSTGSNAAYPSGYGVPAATVPTATPIAPATPVAQPGQIIVTTPGGG